VTQEQALSIIVPCYNEEEVICATHDEIIKQLSNIDNLNLEIIYIDDGSSDTTLDILSKISSRETVARIIVVQLSRNFGHQAAVTAGLEKCTGDVVVVLDADLQDPPELVIQMLDLWRQGFDIVNAVRTKRKEGWALKFAYFFYYRIYRSVANIEVPIDTGDFALLDRKVVDKLNQMPEKNRFVRGLRAWVGYNQTQLSYERNARFAGVSKYPLSKLMKLAFDGIFNFSTAPLTFIFYTGIFTFLLSIALIFILIAVKIFNIPIAGNLPTDIPGYFSTITIILLLSGVQMICLGIIGEYIGRIYLEVKNRPTYIEK
jgi:glycosyltransferase involved in cell wall biosynthesis